MERNDNFVTSDTRESRRPKICEATLASPPNIPKKRKSNFLDFESSVDNANQNDGEELLIQDNEIEAKYICDEDQVLSIPRLFGKLERGTNQKVESIDMSTTERVEIEEGCHDDIQHIVVTPESLISRSSNLCCKIIDTENCSNRQGQRDSVSTDLSLSLPAEMKKSKSYPSSLSKSAVSPIVFHGTCAR